MLAVSNGEADDEHVRADDEQGRSAVDAANIGDPTGGHSHVGGDGGDDEVVVGGDGQDLSDHDI